MAWEIIEGDRPEDEIIILYINDPVRDLMEEVKECQENEQQP